MGVTGRLLSERERSDKIAWVAETRSCPPADQQRRQEPQRQIRALEARSIRHVSAFQAHIMHRHRIQTFWLRDNINTEIILCRSYVYDTGLLSVIPSWRHCSQLSSSACLAEFLALYGKAGQDGLEQCRDA